MMTSLSSPYNPYNKINDSQISISHKRQIDSSQLSSLIQKHFNFYQKICLIDYERLEATTDVEHLYKEALDSVTTKMMTNADMMEDENDDYAMDCYF